MAAVAQQAPEDPVTAIRHFNRFYTRRIGVLNRGFLESDFALTEVRVLYELAYRTHAVASVIGAELGLDPGYLSRILCDFKKRSLVQRSRSSQDARQSLLRLTPKGRNAFARLESRQQEEVSAMISPLPVDSQRRLLASMHTIEHLLAPESAAQEPFIIRPQRPGDMGWIVHRHGVLYAQEYGYDERFEALVAKIVGEFVLHLDPKCERSWIAEREGEIVGSVFLVKKSKSVSKLRLLLVEPSARGLGIGRRLVEECIRFARQAGYKKMVLWTQSELLAARRIYQRSGFKLLSKHRHSDFGKPCISEDWELSL